MLVTFSFNRQKDGAIFKAYFQAVPKIGQCFAGPVPEDECLLMQTNDTQ